MTVLNLKKNSNLFLLVLLLVAVSSAVYGGEKVYKPVSLSGPYSNNTGGFSGSFGSARNSADIIQELYCERSSSFVACSAKDSSGANLACITTDPAHYAAFDSMTDSTYIDVQFNGAYCTEIIVMKASSYEPKQ